MKQTTDCITKYYDSFKQEPTKLRWKILARVRQAEKLVNIASFNNLFKQSKSAAGSGGKLKTILTLKINEALNAN